MESIGSLMVLAVLESFSWNVETVHRSNYSDMLAIFGSFGEPRSGVGLLGMKPATGFVALIDSELLFDG